MTNGHRKNDLQVFPANLRQVLQITETDTPRHVRFLKTFETKRGTGFADPP
ncbi:hypothetical protein C8N32_1054 [Rhodovulum imhoffii]|uniref:Uncharacterized protein n=1 Tax=Rhodovulum imhoffii TaxID=365340 RepID=A0A2T5BTA4_9RHOB|nr:hypothetical protein C8N32_1054 [Rhodovulum imhoffii]